MISVKMLFVIAILYHIFSFKSKKGAILLIRCFQKEFELNKQEIKLGKLSSLNKSLDWE